MLVRLVKGQSQAGTPAGWVPTLRLGLVRDILDNKLLPSLQVVEGTFDTLTSQQWVEFGPYAVGATALWVVLLAGLSKMMMCCMQTMMRHGLCIWRRLHKQDEQSCSAESLLHKGALFHHYAPAALHMPLTAVLCWLWLYGTGLLWQTSNQPSRVQSRSSKNCYRT